MVLRKERRRREEKGELLNGEVDGDAEGADDLGGLEAGDPEAGEGEGVEEAALPDRLSGGVLGLALGYDALQPFPGRPLSLFHPHPRPPGLSSGHRSRYVSPAWWNHRNKRGTGSGPRAHRLTLVCLEACSYGQGCRCVTTKNGNLLGRGSILFLII